MSALLRARRAGTFSSRWPASALLLSHGLCAQDAPTTQSQQEHVPPDPPTAQDDHPMSYRAMAREMQMDDRSAIGKVMLDRLEWRDTSGASAFEWNGEAWYGNDSDKIWLKAEGERRAGGDRDRAHRAAVESHVQSMVERADRSAPRLRHRPFTQLGRARRAGPGARFHRRRSHCFI